MRSADSGFEMPVNCDGPLDTGQLPLPGLISPTASRTTGSSTAPFGSGRAESVVPLPAYFTETFPCERSSGVVAVMFWFGSFGLSDPAALSHTVCWLETVVCWSFEPLMLDCSHCHAWLFNACQVSGLFFPRGWPTSASATSTGQRGLRLLRYLNWRKDSTGVNRSSVQPWIEKTATRRGPSAWAFQPSSW